MKKAAKTHKLETDNNTVEDHVSCPEKTIEACANPPWPLRLFCQSGINRIYDKQIKNTPEYTCETPTIAFRGSHEIPENIFRKGFSAYATNRPPYSCSSPECSDCNSPTGFCLTSCLTAFKAPILPVIALVKTILCIKSCFPHQHSHSLGGYFGQNRIDGIYRSNWSSLALSKDFNFATPYLTPDVRKPFWRYIVLLPEGYIDFSAFCNKYLDERFPGGVGIDRNAGSYDVQEIFPRNAQRVNSKHIIAAVEIIRSENRYGEIKLNPHFIGYSAIENEMRGQDINDQKEYLTKLINFAKTQYENNQIENIIDVENLVMEREEKKEESNLIPQRF